MSSRAGNTRGDSQAKENDTNGVEAAVAADEGQRLPSGGSSSLSSPGGSSSSTSSSGGATGGAGGAGGGAPSPVEEAFHPPQHAYPQRAYPLHAQHRHHPSMPLPPPPPPPPPHSAPTHAPSRGRRTAEGAAASSASPAAAVPGSSTAADATSANSAATGPSDAMHHYQPPHPTQATPTSRSRSRPRAVVIPPSAPRGGVQGALADLNATGGDAEGGSAGAPTGAAAYRRQQQSRGRGESKDAKESQAQHHHQKQQHGQHGADRTGQSGGAARSSSKEAPSRTASHPGAPEAKTDRSGSSSSSSSSSSNSSSSSSADEHSSSGGDAERSGKHQATPPQEHGRSRSAAAGSGQRGPSLHQRPPPPPPPPPHGMYGYFPYHYPPHSTSTAMYPPYHGTPHNYPTPGANSLMTEGGTPSSMMMSPTPLGSINAEIEGEAPAKHQERDRDIQDLFHTLNAPSFDDSSSFARPPGSPSRQAASRSQHSTSSKQHQGRRHPAQMQHHQQQQHHQQEQQSRAKSSGRPSGTPVSQGKPSDVSSQKSAPVAPTDSTKPPQAGRSQPPRHPQGGAGAGAVPMPGPFPHFGNPFAFQQSMMWHHMQQMQQSHQDSTRTNAITPSSSKKQKESGEGTPSTAAAAATAAAFFPGYPPFMMGQQQPHPTGAAHHMYGFGPVPTAPSKSSDGKQKQQGRPPPQQLPASYYAGMGMPWGPGWPGSFPPYAPYGGQVPPRDAGASDDDVRSGGKEDTQDEVDRHASKANEVPSTKAKTSAPPPKKRAEVSVAFEDEASTATPPEQKKQRVKHGEHRSMSSNSLTDMVSPRKTSSPDKRGSKRSAALHLQSPHIPRTPSGAGYYNSFGTPAGQDHGIEYGRDLFATNSFGGFSINDGDVGSPNHHWDTGLEDWRPETSSGQRRYGGDIASPFPTTDMFNMSPMMGSGGASAMLGSPVGDNSMGIYRPPHIQSPSGRGMRPDLEPLPMLSASSSKKGKEKSKKKKGKSPSQKSRPTPRSLHPPPSPQPPQEEEEPDSSARNPLGLENPMTSSDDPMRYFVQLGGAGSTIGDVRRGMNDINAAMERARAMMPLPPPPPPPPPPSSFTGTPSVYYPSAGGYGDAMSYSGPMDRPQGADIGLRDASTRALRTEPEYRTPARSSKSGSRSKSRPRSSSDVNFAEFEPPRSRSETHRAPSAPQAASAKAVDVTPSSVGSSASGKKQRTSSSKTSAAKAPAKTPSKKASARSTRETPRRKTPPSSRKSRPMPTPSPVNKGAGRSNKGCNCKKSKCLKKYCECFAGQAYCSDDCRCQNCCNTVEHEDLRSKAIEEMKRKDSDAFEQKTFSCNCKKSKCLKKYCDCFQAGNMCGESCKCKDCENYKGSQKLIDRRTKIKDTKGAELAMTASDEIWRGEQPAQVTPAAAAPPTSTVSRRRGSPAASYSSSPASMLDDPSAVTSMHPQFDAGSAGHSRHPAEIGYSPASMRTPMHGPQVEAAKRAAASAARSSNASRKRQSATSRAANAGSTARSAPSHSKSSRLSRVVTASHPGRGVRKRSRTPKSPVQSKVRVDFDPIASKRRRRLRPGHQEATRKYFGGKRPAVSKTSALTVFSYFSNEDTYNASLVSKQWNDLAFDDELWQLE